MRSQEWVRSQDDSLRIYHIGFGCLVKSRLAFQHHRDFLPHRPYHIARKASIQVGPERTFYAASIDYIVVNFKKQRMCGDLVVKWFMGTYLRTVGGLVHTHGTSSGFWIRKNFVADWFEKDVLAVGCSIQSSARSFDESHVGSYWIFQHEQVTLYVMV